MARPQSLSRVRSSSSKTTINDLLGMWPACDRRPRLGRSVENQSRYPKPLREQEYYGYR
jgi:hypothetical protein